MSEESKEEFLDEMQKKFIKSITHLLKNDEKVEKVTFDPNNFEIFVPQFL
jgi:hypothetical protein